MRITIKLNDAEVDLDVADDDWVAEAADACWRLLRARHVEGKATAYEPDGARICTVTYELHDE